MLQSFGPSCPCCKSPRSNRLATYHGTQLSGRMKVACHDTKPVELSSVNWPKGVSQCPPSKQPAAQLNQGNDNLPSIQPPRETVKMKSQDCQMKCKMLHFQIQRVGNFSELELQNASLPTSTHGHLMQQLIREALHLR